MADTVFQQASEAKVDMSVDSARRSLFQRLSPYIILLLAIGFAVLAITTYTFSSSLRSAENQLRQKEQAVADVGRLEAQLAILAVEHATAARLAKERLKAVDDLTKKNLDLDTTNKELNHKYGALQHEHKAYKTKASNVAKNQITRSISGVKRHIATAPGKAVPVAGIAVVATVTAWDVMETCQAMSEMETLTEDADGIGFKIAEACKQYVPTTADLTKTIKSGWRRAYDAAMSQVPNRKPLAPSTESAADTAEKLVR